MVSGTKIAFGERNAYGVNPTYTTIDIEDADICMNFNDCPVLPFSDASIDVLFTSHALEHLIEARVRMFLKEAFRTLRKGGKLLVELPDCEYLYKSWRAGETGVFEQFVFDEEAGRLTGHPEIVGRKDIAFGGVVSCINRKNSAGLYQHTPVVFGVEEFEKRISCLGMDEFFDWLLGLQTDEEKQTGGHNSAWYPSKLRSALEEAGFGSISRPSSFKVAPFLFRGGFRPTYSFRAMAIK